MKKIFLTGYYGQSNFGDDLFQDSFKKYLEKNYEDITVDNYSPLNKGKLSRITRVLNMLINIFKNDVIIFAGGSILSSRGSTRMKKLQYILTKLLNKTVMAYGVSYGPFDNYRSKSFYHKFIKNLDYISLRDLDSYKKVNEIQGINNDIVYFSGDIATIIPEVYHLPATQNKSVLGISLCYYEKYTEHDDQEEKEFLRKLIENIKNTISRYDEILIFALKTGDLGDEELAEYQYQVYSEIHNNVTIVYHQNDILPTLSSINNTTHFISMRLHAMIPAIILNKKTLAIEYHDKCRDFLNTITYPRNLRISRVDYSHESFNDKLNDLYRTNNFKSKKLESYKNAYLGSRNKLREIFDK